MGNGQSQNPKSITRRQKSKVKLFICLYAFLMKFSACFNSVNARLRQIKYIYLALFSFTVLLFSFTLLQAFHEEYSRLYELSKEETTPQEDARLQHALVYFFQNKAPKRIIERTLLEQFTDRNLSFDERYTQITCPLMSLILVKFSEVIKMIIQISYSQNIG